MPMIGDKYACVDCEISTNEEVCWVCDQKTKHWENIEPALRNQIGGLSSPAHYHFETEGDLS